MADIYLELKQLRLLFLFLLVVSMTSFSHAQTQSVRPDENQKQPRRPIKTAFVNITGEEKLSQRLWKLLDIELGELGIGLSTSERTADATISVTISTGRTQSNLYVGVIKSWVNPSTTNPSEDCASISTDKGPDLFGPGSSASVVKRVEGVSPKGKNVRIDESSDFKESPKLQYEIAGALKSAGFQVVETGASDVSVKIELRNESVPITEEEIRYEGEVRTVDSPFPSRYTGTATRSAELREKPLAICPDRFKDLNWLLMGGRDLLGGLAREIAQYLDRSNSGKK